jgi:hypothetical protein
MLPHIADLDSLAQQNRRISVRKKRRQGSLKAKLHEIRDLAIRFPPETLRVRSL